MSFSLAVIAWVLLILTASDKLFIDYHQRRRGLRCLVDSISNIIGDGTSPRHKTSCSSPFVGISLYLLHDRVSLGHRLFLPESRQQRCKTGRLARVWASYYVHHTDLAGMMQSSFTLQVCTKRKILKFKMKQNAENVPKLETKGTLEENT